ncbi:hypothetical protein P3H15_39410 [Rhodococcus sp. T2V]|uniref:hypothetical protein n=1 Tax=Rhodococcus sp. T2V TaxID=3034164 RepID=UPI0023E29E91|nr:hypothetical protein [Rhodococcus sp. T2V]MDF3311069.1 hypothetical protein [Rhodococcus sp. T2V]
MLAEIGEDRDRFPNPSGLRASAGAAPITSASGRSQYVKHARSETSAPATPVPGGRSQCSPNLPAPARTTTNAVPPATITMRPCATSPQASRTPVVVPAARRTLGRFRRLARPSA